MSDLEQPIVNDAPKWLRKLVYIMGGVLVLLFIGVLVGLFYKLRKPPAPPPVPVELNFSGADVQHMALDGNHLAITSAHEIVVIDINSGKALLRLPLK
jgi:hypothetical protein